MSNQIIYPGVKGFPIPNRVFVGGLPSHTKEGELRSLFLPYGLVKDVKIIYNRISTKRSYGFVTFDNQDAVDRLVEKDSKEKIFFKSRHINIGYAYKKYRTSSGLSDEVDNSMTSNSELSYLYDNSMPMIYMATQENSFVPSQLTPQRGFYAGNISSPMPQLASDNRGNYGSVSYSIQDAPQCHSARTTQPGNMNESFQSPVICTPPSPNHPPNWRFSIPAPFMSPMMTPLMGSSSQMISPMQCSEMIYFYGAQYPSWGEFYPNTDAASTPATGAVVKNAPLPIEHAFKNKIADQTGQL